METRKSPRAKTLVTYFQNSDSDDEYVDKPKKKSQNKKKEPKKPKTENKQTKKRKVEQSAVLNAIPPSFDDLYPISVLESASITELQELYLPQIEKEIEQLTKEIDEAEIQEQNAPQQESDDDEEEEVPMHDLPPDSIPINKDLTTIQWEEWGKHVHFNVIMMDPAWTLTGSNPTRGVALGYNQLSEEALDDLFRNIGYVQKHGFLFVWVINRFYMWTLERMQKYGYKVVDEVVWIKTTSTRKWAKSHGYYLQHGKETCLVALKGNPPTHFKGAIGRDVIFSERKGQSQKPSEIYDLIEELVPHGPYLELFARRNNLRNFWTSIGMEL